MNIGIIFAGGSGQRMNTKARPKQFLELNGKPIIIYTIELFDYHPYIDAIVVVCIESWIPFLKKMLKKYEINKVVAVVSGGATGQESIYKGLCAAETYVKGQSSDKDIVLIHDGVRPLITEETISENIVKVKTEGSCITCVPAQETIIINHPDKSGDFLIPQRKECLIARAPQSFYLKEIIEAHRRNQQEEKLEFIDSCSLMKHYGKKLGVIIGPMENIKITTPSDFFVFRAMVEVHENQQIFGIY